MAGLPSRRLARGASLFEFAVAIIIMAVLGGVLLGRVLRYQAEAERTGVNYQVAILRSALASHVMEAGIAADPQQLAAFDGINPVALLQRPPPGYRGEFDHPDDTEMAGGSWYFDRKQRILVYVFSRNETFLDVLPKKWCFRVELSRLPTNNAKPPGTPGSSFGVALHQVDG
ncbi:hypothetical protein IP91_00517 [Pseudoduganella lurida]|uniref:Type II secretion system protein n=1 Tax=Pseudoduganella lurida TaxID=1036180 RepID=A0A562RK80_9BURK|nr:hypothetical protein [Pseudoduganella lurida]TWI69449.1 hypothetical protein IP91_00517 [Pseudoduganella lurida]